jgi:hypothetical protein
MNGVRLRPVALPAEHGGWGFLLEPIVLGLALAPSLAGLWLAVAALCAFLARHPLRLLLGDWRRRRRLARTPVAAVLVVVYGIAGIAFFSGAFISPHLPFLPALLLAAPIALFQLGCDATGRSRTLAAELAGAIAAGSLATAILLAAGWRPPVAFAIWAILAARSVPTILYVRTRLRILHRKPVSSRAALIAHLTAILAVAGLVRFGLAPVLAIAAFAVLFMRAAIGFSKHQIIMTAKQLGVSELAFGAMTVLSVILGYRLA